ncbi:MAG: monooxygenase, FAD-binding [uncultured Solirubrobacteraceae bacterium]|uniref:Monooxygenase, FAD-binding n=1 Tax=uncultured Solirubrobacteraceae bacterium TaxID=1162706 RepID=A0A6J4S4X3_9ACTN|nr:MAG: monooxygenase, FAD-binding [uncultured Solirubrobacteraceae bacterium]
MRVLIVGAGIAGLSVALRLGQLGIESTVVERAPAERGGGYMIDFFGPGIAAAERLGLHGALGAIHHPVDRLTFVDEAARRRFSVDYAVMRRRLFRGRHFNFLRGDLEHVLRGSARAGTRVVFGRRVVAVMPATGPRDPVGVAYEDGSTEEWDVVIGADGVNSQVRRSLLAGDEWTRVDLGHTVAAWTLDGHLPGVPANDFTTLTAPGRMVAAYPVHGERTATFLVHRSGDSAADLAAGLPATLTRVFGDLGWVVPDLLAALPTVTDPYFDATIQIRSDVWHRGRVILLGDACWCVSLLAGQGSSLAMAGGVALAEALAARPDDVPAALDGYSARLGPVVRSLADAGARTAGWFVPERRWRMAVRDLSVRASTWPLVAPLGGRRLGIGRASA